MGAFVGGANPTGKLQSEVYLWLSMHACVTHVYPFSTSVLGSSFLCVKIHISGHLLNLPSNYHRVICFQQWLRDLWLSMHACVTHVYPFLTSVLGSTFLCGKSRISGHLLNLASNYIHVICFQQWLQNIRGVLVTVYACFLGLCCAWVRAKVILMRTCGVSQPYVLLYMFFFCVDPGTK